MSESGIRTGGGRETQGVTLVVVVLAVLLGGLTVAGNRRDTWPLLIWDMYSTELRSAPPGRVERIEIVGFDRNGRRHRFQAGDLVPAGRESSVEMVLRSIANGEDEYERCIQLHHLAKAIGGLRARPDIRVLELWLLAWNVNLKQSPPVAREYPDRILLHRDALADCAHIGE